MKRVRSAAPNPSPFVKLEAWDGLTPAVEFQVTGEPGWFRFTAHVTDPATGSTWIDAVGGRGGKRPRRQQRSFPADRIRTDRRGRRVIRRAAERA